MFDHRTCLSTLVDQELLDNPTAQILMSSAPDECGNARLDPMFFIFRGCSPEGTVIKCRLEFLFSVEDDHAGGYVVVVAVRSACLASCTASAMASMVK